MAIGAKADRLSETGVESREFVSATGWTSREGLSYWSRNENTGLKRHHLHFWAISDPLERVVLRIAPTHPGEGISGVLRFFNANGTVGSECQLVIKAGQMAQIPLNALLANCATDSGFRHSHLELETAEECTGELEFSSRTRSSFFSSLHRVVDREPRAFPVVVSPSYRHVLALVNPNDVQASLKCRMYLGSRTPEEACLLPPRSTVLLSPEVLFQRVISEVAPEGEIQAYVRLTTRSPKPLGFQVLEERIFESGERAYGVVS
ncbi:MAG: hypothetical protein KDD70_00945 [Bdellovibrionales bacterium]|nr:hypothetical protein [Bdellovibrionales bacterium]